MSKFIFIAKNYAFFEKSRNYFVKCDNIKQRSFNFNVDTLLASMSD